MIEFLKATRSDGTPVFLAVDRISAITGHWSDSGETLVYMSGEVAEPWIVKESVEDILATLGASWSEVKS